MVNKVPTELTLHTGGYLVGFSMKRFDLEDLAVFCPDVIAASHTAVGADCLCLLDTVFAHLSLGLRDLHDGSVPHLRLDSLDDVDHLVKSFFRHTTQVAGFS